MERAYFRVEERFYQKGRRVTGGLFLSLPFMAIAILLKDPFKNPPPFEKLVGNLSGAYSRRINIQHRLVYQVLDDVRTVKVLRLWTHYE